MLKIDFGYFLPTFVKTFPKMIEYIQKFDSFCNLKNGLKDPIAIKEQNAFMLKFEDEFQLFSEEWNCLKKSKSQSINRHIIRFFVQIFHDDDFKNLQENTKNLILWTSLLHDIGKRGFPYIQNSDRDPFHSFTSGALALKIISRYVKIEKIDKINALSDFIKNAFIIKTDINNNSLEYCDTSKLDQILCDLEIIFKRNTDLYLMIKLILLHQSLDVISDYPPMAPLSEEQVCNYCDIEFIKLLKILCVADSTSYHLNSPEEMNYYQNLLNEGFDKLKKKIISHTNKNA